MSHRRHNTTVLEPLDLPSRRSYPLAPPPARSSPGMRRASRRRPSVLGQWGWGLWDLTLRLIEFGLKTVGAALIVLAIVIGALIYGWHHVVEAGVEKLQQVTTTTTTAP